MSCRSIAPLNLCLQLIVESRGSLRWDRLWSRLTVVVAAAIVSMLAQSQVAQACSCLPKSPGDAFRSADLVFMGEILEVSSDSLSTRGRLRLVQARVLKTWKGVGQERTITVKTGMGGGDCGFDFETGKTYLIYAWRNRGQVYAGMCTRTTDYERARDDILYLDRLPGLKTTSYVYGYVRDRSKFWVRAEVTLAGDKGLVRTTWTDAEGRFEIGELSAGDYNLTLPQPPELDPDPLHHPVRLKENDCAEVFFYPGSGGRVEGQISDRDGQPAGLLSVEMLPVDRNLARLSSHHDVAAGNGSFVFRHLRPGRYRVAVVLGDGNPGQRNLLYYPGTNDSTAADIITVEAGARFRLTELTLPSRLVRRTLDGIVYIGEKPASGVRVILRSVYRQDQTVTDLDGRFSFSGYEHEKYSITATLPMSEVNSERVLGSYVEVVVAPNTPAAPLKLVLPSQRKLN